MSAGQRIVCNGKRGTIKYVGEMPSHHGIYYGVDWDDPQDGKHDGTYNGVKYFDTEYPTSGSFIKATDADFGYKFVDAARDQYEYDIDRNYEEHAADFIELKKKLRVTTLEFIGFEEIRRLQGPLKKMRIVNLSMHDVNSPGEYGEIESVCPCIQDLEISNNLMTDWEQIAIIGKQLKDLHCLKMNNTRVKMTVDPERFADDFLQLTDLILCRCAYCWTDILRGAVMWPKLQALKIPFNRVTSLETPVNVLQDLRIIDLMGNEITSWLEINKIGHLKNLETLNISRNKISQVSIPPDKGLFPSLNTLFMADCNVDQWHLMVDLNNLPSLKFLKFKRNPVMKDDEPAIYRQKIISRIASIKILNGQEIVAKERDGAEYDYVKELAEQWCNCEKSDIKRTQFLQRNPRYIELIKIYGLPEISKPLDVSLKANLISVTLSLINEDGTIKKSLTKKFHCSMLVYKLVTIVKRLFSIGTTRPKLTFVSAMNPEIKLEMENDLKPLDSYGVTDGDTVMVSV